LVTTIGGASRTSSVASRRRIRRALRAGERPSAMVFRYVPATLLVTSAENVHSPPAARVPPDSAMDAPPAVTVPGPQVVAACGVAATVTLLEARRREATPVSATAPEPWFAI